MWATRAYLVLSALFAGMGWGCGDLVTGLSNQPDQAASATFNSVVPAAGRTRLQVEGVTGTITVGGDSAASELRIGGTRRVAAASLSEAQSRLAGLQVEIDPGLDVVRVRTVQPRDTGGREYTVNYTITLPARMAVNVKNVTGTVRVTNINEAVAVDLVTGDVRLERIVGAAAVSLITGSIQSQVTLQPHAAIALAVVTGNIALRIPAATSAMMTAQVVTGGATVTNLTLQDERRTPNSLRARLGDGQGTITLSAVTGAINITGI